METCLCPKCGATLPAKAKFCGVCGSRIEQAIETETVLPVAAVPNQQETVQPVQQEAVQPVQQEAVQPVQQEAYKPMQQDTRQLVYQEDQPKEDDYRRVEDDYRRVEDDYRRVEDETYQPFRQVAYEPVQPAPNNYSYQNTAWEAPAAPAAAKTKGAKPLRKRSAGAVVLSVFLCILIFIWSFPALVLGDAQIALAPDNIDKTLSSVVNAEQIGKLPAHILFTDVKDMDQTLVDWSVDQIEIAYNNTITLSEDVVEEFLEESTLFTFLVEEIGDYILDVRDGTDNSGISKSEITDLVEDNADVISDLVHEEVKSAQVEYITNQIVGTGMTDMLEASELRDQVPAAYYALRFIPSYWTIGLFILLSVLFILLLAKVNRWSFVHTCGDLGIVLTVLSGVLLVATGFAVWLPDVWGMMFQPLTQIGVLAGQILVSGLICNVIVFAAGLLMIIVKSLVKAVLARTA